MDKKSKIIDLVRTGHLKDVNFYANRDKKWLEQRAVIWNKFSKVSDVALTHSSKAIPVVCILGGGANGVISANTAEAFFTYPFYVLGGAIFGGLLGAIGGLSTNAVRNIFFEPSKSEAKQGYILGLLSYVGIMFGQSFNKTYPLENHHHIPLVDKVELPHKGLSEAWKELKKISVNQNSQNGSVDSYSLSSDKFSVIPVISGETTNYNVNFSKTTNYQTLTLKPCEQTTFTSRLDKEKQLSIKNKTLI